MLMCRKAGTAHTGMQACLEDNSDFHAKVRIWVSRFIWCYCPPGRTQDVLVHLASASCVLGAYLTAATRDDVFCLRSYTKAEEGICSANRACLQSCIKPGRRNAVPFPSPRVPRQSSLPSTKDTGISSA